MKRLIVLLPGISMILWATGCCCHQGYPSYYGGACPGGNCGYADPAAPMVYPQGASIESVNSTYAAAPAGTPATVAVAPPINGMVYQQTAMMPLESLPTY